MRRDLILGLVLICGLWFWQVGFSSPLSVQSFTIEIAPTRQIAGRLYLPSATAEMSAPHLLPALLLCHGVNSSKDTLAILAQDLARHDIAAVVFDFGGYGQSYARANSEAANLTDAAAVLQWMRQSPQLNPQQLGVVGHSMGGTTALELARANPDLNATVLLSIAGWATPTSPANLLMGSGVHEELNPVGDMEAVFAAAVDEPVQPLTTVGDFAQGTARRLVFSSTVDHALAPYDRMLHREVINWAQQSFKQPVRSISLSGQTKLMGMVLSIGAAMGWVLRGYAHLLPWGKWRLIAGTGVGLFIVLVLGYGRAGSAYAIAGILPFLIGNAHYHHPQARSMAMRHTLIYAALIYGLVLLAIAFNALLTGSLLAMPQAILGLPVLAKTMIFGLLYDRFHLLRYALDSRVGVGFLASLIAVEMAKPGFVVRALGAIATRFIDFIRQPLVWHWQPVPRSTLWLMPLLLGMLGFILFQQQQAGILTWEAGQFALRLVGVFLLMPGGVFVFVVRSRWFRRLETRFCSA